MNRPLSLLFLLVGFLSLAGAVAAQDTTALRQEISANPKSAPVILAQVLKAAGPNASLLAGPATAAAIESLGIQATGNQISAIVYAAVRVLPDSALKIVRAAVNAAPKAAPYIAAAAVRAVPNPWKLVRYQRREPLVPTAPTATGGTNAVGPANDGAIAREPDFNSLRDCAFEDAINASLDPNATGGLMTLAEAIVRTAYDAHSGVDCASVQSAVDAALVGEPGALFMAVGGARGLAGVGNAGTSNYANEPFIPPQMSTPAHGGKPSPAPPVRPNPPPVSP